MPPHSVPEAQPCGRDQSLSRGPREEREAGPAMEAKPEMADSRNPLAGPGPQRFPRALHTHQRVRRCAWTLRPDPGGPGRCVSGWHRPRGPAVTLTPLRATPVASWGFFLTTETGGLGCGAYTQLLTRCRHPEGRQLRALADTEGPEGNLPGARTLGQPGRARGADKEECA